MAGGRASRKLPGRSIDLGDAPCYVPGMRAPHRLALLLVVLAGCRSQAQAPRTPEAALRELGDAARASDLARLQRVLDTESRWSLITIHKDQLKLCGLVRAHYPKERQRLELSRCRLADGARDPEALFATWARERGLVVAFAKLPAEGKATVVGERATFSAAGGEHTFCREGDGWLYCGLRAELEQLKLKAARDVATVQENVEAYRGR